MNCTWLDVRYGLRLLARSPGFTTAVVLLLALGIGLNTAVFSYLNVLFLRPLPAVEQPEQVLALYSTVRDSPGLLPISYPNYLDLAAWNESFSGLAAYQTIWVGLSGTGESEQVIGEMVSSNYFQVLGVEPVLGRTFTAGEAAVPAGEPVVVLSHDLWQNRFAGDPGVLGRKTSINGRPFTVIGVAPESFKGPSSISPARLWVPLGSYPVVFIAPELFLERSAQLLQVLGRIEPGRSARVAEADVARLAALLSRQHPDANKGATLVAVPLSRANLPPGLRARWLKSGAFLSILFGILLLAACANVTNLLLMRTAARSRELALRLSLGAGRRHIFRQVLSEILLLALLGGVCSLAVTSWTWSLLVRLKPPYLAPGSLEMAFNTRLLGFVLIATLMTAALVGLAPMLTTLRVDLASALKAPSGLLESTSKRSAASYFLILAQVTLSAIAVVCSGSILRSLAAAQGIDPGFDAQRLLTVSFDLQSQGYGETRGRLFAERLIQRVTALPGVEAASLGENGPMNGFRFFRSLSRLGPHAQSQEDAVMVGSSIVDDRYFATLGIPLVQGRPFGAGDRAGAPQVAVVNEALARQLWPAGFSPGALLWLDYEETPVEVIGVVRNAKLISLEEEPRPALYLPLGQRYSGRATLHLRTRTPDLLLGSVKHELRVLDRALPLINLETTADTIRRSLWAPRMNAILLSALASVVLSVAAVGVYGVAAYSAFSRRREIAIRLALGAERRRILCRFVCSGGAWISAGIALGLFGAFALNRWLSKFFYLPGGESWTVFILTAVLLLAVGLLANFLPAFRATRLNPADILRFP